MSLKRTILILILISFFAIALRGERNNHPYIPSLVEIYDESDLDSLAKEGVEILRRRGDILLCLFPNTDTRSAGASFRQRNIAPTLDTAKGFNEAYTVQNGEAAGTPYTGKGVVVGICDIGIDPLHPTFLDADGKSRIKRVVQYIERKGIRRQLDGDEDYLRWTTDNPDNYHATHVCGILAGNGAGTPYSGIATDADIVVTVSTLTEVGLLAGVEDIIDYAKEAGKPAVINISVGSYTGPHDGTSLFSRYLDMCAEDAFIVMSAGNEGHRTNSLITNFTPERNSVSFSIGNKEWTQFSMYGATDIWSGSSEPLSISLGIYDYNQKSIVRWLDNFTLTGGDCRSYIWDESAYQQGEIPFIGELEIEGAVDEGNGRHRTILGYEYSAPEKAQDGNWARYGLTLKVSGSPGNDLEVYSDGTYTRLIGMSGSPYPTSDRTVSDLACGNKVICVGMYGNRDSIPYSAPAEFNDDTIYFDQTGYEAGKITRYSSYGTLRDGRVLPHTVAPGAPLISAGSRPFLSLYPYHRHLRMNGTQWLSEAGTSMSSPYVAGYIATWLEAVPTLTLDDVTDIIARSNRIDIPDPDNPRNSNGYFDPVQGLKLALKTEGVESIGHPEWVISPDDHVDVYDIAGVKKYSGPYSGVSDLARGLYIVHTSRSVMKGILPLR